MEREIKHIDVVKFPVLFVRSLAKDFEDQDLTWMQLYAKLFIKGTDIYREMRVTLVSLGLKMRDKVSYEHTYEVTKESQITFLIEEEDRGRRILTHGKTNEKTIVPKSVSTPVALAKLGYTQKVKK